MTSLPPSDKRRLKSTAALLASDQPGEAQAALEAMNRLLGKHGLDFNTILDDAIAEEAPPPDTRSRSERCRPVWGSGKKETEHQALARVLLQTGFRWNEWELSFLRAQVNRASPSARERSKLVELRRHFWGRPRA